MARPLRIEIENGCYHVMARGNRREAIYRGDSDREYFLERLGKVSNRRGWNILAYCLMTNHYHLLIHTLEPNLSIGMRDVNGVYSQQFNRRHRRVGHVLQGRYTAHLVDEDSYLKEVARYVVLNPVRARMVEGPRQYRWSSYRDTIGLRQSPDWLAVDTLLGTFGTRRQAAIQEYREFVRAGIKTGGKLGDLKHGLFYGSDRFVDRLMTKLDRPTELREYDATHRRALTKPLAWYAERYKRNEAIARAWASGQYTLKQLGTYFGLHYASISRLVRQCSEDV